MLYKDWIKNLREEWIGKKILFNGRVYNVVDVDYNGVLLIDKPGRFTNTTAVGTVEDYKDRVV